MLKQPGPPTDFMIVVCRSIKEPKGKHGAKLAGAGEAKAQGMDRKRNRPQKRDSDITTGSQLS
jgi:hypothetical protein